MKHPNEIEENMCYEIAGLVTSYIELAGEEQRKRNKKPNDEETNTEEDNVEEAEYKKIDRIGFSITMDSNVDELLSEYGKECMRHGIQPQSEISYSIESAGIRFPISEESGKAITEKWIRLIELKRKELEEGDHHVVINDDTGKYDCW